jgi:dihydrofolate synthase/folylpolyglutamate synthase
VASPVAEDFTVRFTVRERPASPGGQTVLDVVGFHGSYPALAVAAPAYQAGNVAAALAASEAALGRVLDIEAVRAALLGVRLPGRFELVRDEPPLVVDGAHNPQAAHVLAEAISHAWPDADARPIVLLGMLSGKDAAGVVEALAPVASGFAVASPDSPRALGATELASVVLAATGRRPAVFASVVEAALSLVASPLARAGMVVTGSLTSAGQVRAALRDTSATP